MHLHIRERGDGPALVCLHGGMGLDHHLFLPWFDAMASGVRVVLFDFSGNGASRPDTGADGMGHEAWVRDIESVRAHLGLDRIAILGHSYGGILAQEYALRNPDRVESLILSNTAPVVDFGELIFANAQSRGTPEQVELAARVLTTAVQDEAELEASFRELLPLYFHRWDGDAAQQLLEGVRYRAEAFNVGNSRELPCFDAREGLTGLEIPTLVISGDDDWIMPESVGGRRLAGLVPDARHVVLPECGHFSYVEHPERFAELVTAFAREWHA